jgi:Fungal protein kinase
LPFMSIELLVSRKPVYHKPRHDLESIFFVFIYLCTNLSGPGLPRPLHELQKLESLPIASWFNPDFSMERLGADKISAMMLINQRIIPYFADYFLDLKSCAFDLYKAIYPTFQSLLEPVDVPHDTIIQIFNDTLKKLPEVDFVPTASSSQASKSTTSTGRRQRKRSLGIHDNTLHFSRLTKRKKSSLVNCSNPGIRSSTGSRSLISASSPPNL